MTALETSFAIPVHRRVEWRSASCAEVTEFRRRAQETPLSRAAAHHIGRYPPDEPEANFHVQEFLAGRSVLRAICFLGAFSRTSFAVFSVESGAETVVETGGFDRTEDDGFERMSGATKGASEYCTIIAGGGL
jgi:hypothetical protein